MIVACIAAAFAPINAAHCSTGLHMIVSACSYLVEGARALGLEVIDRCNLTVLLEPGQEDLPDFLAKHQVRNATS